jgi:hypothetical protein
MQLDGYLASSRGASADLREALRASGQFVETENGEWIMSKPLIEPFGVLKNVPVEPLRQTNRRRRVAKSRRLVNHKSPGVASMKDSWSRWLQLQVVLGQPENR